MKLFEFIETFPDEESCKRRFKEIRDQQGVKCRKCGGNEHYWKQDKWQYECKKCRTRTTLKSGTVMHGSQLPFRYWFIAMHLLTSTKKSFSAKELQRQLGHKYYEPVWTMLHKLRAAMGKRDDRYKLNEQIELDDGFFTVINQEKSEQLKRGRGSQKKGKVLVMTESLDIPGKKTKKGKTRKVGFIKMKVMQDLKSETVKGLVKENVNKQSKLLTDASTSYVDLKEVVEEHQASVISKEQVGEMLPWVHLAISNAKRLFLDIFHSVQQEYLQYYLNEYCYKFNRRYFNESLFDRLIIACVTYKNDFRYRIQ